MVKENNVPKSSEKFLLLPPRKAMSHSSGLNSQCDVQVIVTDAGETDVDKLEYQKSAYVAVALILAITAVAVLFPIIVTSRLFSLNVSIFYIPPPAPCNETCRVVLVESIPDNLTFTPGSPTHPSIFSAWMDLIGSANESINIASFYWTMRGKDTGVEDHSDWQGEAVFKALLTAGTQKSLKINIVQSQSSSGPVLDTQELEKAGAATVRTLNMTRLLGNGVLHTKFWIVDDKHIYVGSANQDWRSLTQVKELGAVVYNCSCLAKDMAKIFAVYWDLAFPNSSIPAKWPSSYDTRYSMESPMSVRLNGTQANVYISSSPPPFSPKGRSDDLASILNIISHAKKFVHIAVMDYVPLTLYTKHMKFWPLIDDALRTAAIERRVEVKLLASYWNHTRTDMLHCLASLNDLAGVHRANIQVKLFHVPTYTPAQGKIPFARVNHNKYMVTDEVAYIGTSNWSGDYFINTAGVGLVINQTSSTANPKPKVTVQKQLADIFNRDWTSEYAKPLPSHSYEDFLPMS